MVSKTANGINDPPVGHEDALSHPQRAKPCLPRSGAFQETEFSGAQWFAGLLAAFDILNHHFGFAILGDDKRLLLFGKVSNDFSRMGFQVADGSDLC
jgi:hypothetical protein